MNWEKEVLFGLQRREQLLHEAEQSRLAGAAHADRTASLGMVAAVMVQVGQALVSIGKGLIHLSGQPSHNDAKTRYNADSSLAL